MAPPQVPLFLFYKFSPSISVRNLYHPGLTSSKALSEHPKTAIPSQTLPLLSSNQLTLSLYLSACLFFSNYLP